MNRLRRRFLSESAVDKVRERDAAGDDDGPDDAREPLGDGLEVELELLKPPNTSTASANKCLARQSSEEGPGVSPEDISPDIPSLPRGAVQSSSTAIRGVACTCANRS